MFICGRRGECTWEKQPQNIIVYVYMY
uniref:Uncharacterized protein n=1 Tax=Anguilla anguilla TaxID=7936 RepID=A0A0E9PGP2_ANGAN